MHTSGNKRALLFIPKHKGTTHSSCFTPFVCFCMLTDGFHHPFQLPQQSSAQHRDSILDFTSSFYRMSPLHYSAGTLPVMQANTVSSCFSPMLTHGWKQLEKYYLQDDLDPNIKTSGGLCSACENKWVPAEIGTTGCVLISCCPGRELEHSTMEKNRATGFPA